VRLAGPEKSVVLLDTNVASYRYRQSAEFDEFQPFLQGSIAAISVITYGESLFGAHAAGWGEHRVNDYDAHLRKYLILPVDREVVITYAKVAADHQKVGIGLSENDWWIAATAIRYGIPLLTNDAAFRRIRGLKVLPPARP
jgi:tRNA(fMet)-specific endonuclease VapC